MSTITIPSGLTAHNMIKKCDNKTSTGTPVLYNIDWYKDEAFYTTEKTRGGTHEIPTLEHKGKSWNTCHKIAQKEDREMFTFAELLYLMIKHEKETKEHFLGGWEYSWTSSRASVGGLVRVGGFDSAGAGVYSASPGNSKGILGVCLSRMKQRDMSTKSMDLAEASSRSDLEKHVQLLEKRIQTLEEWKQRAIDIWNS